MLRDANCTFCRIVAAELPASVVYEDPYVLAFLDIGPLADGHLLVIPRDHYTKLSEAPPELAGRMAAALPTLGRAVLRVTGAEAFNVLLNEGAVAGQAVPHIHFHVIPRRTGDQLGYRWNPGKYPPGRVVELAAAFQKALAPHAS